MYIDGYLHSIYTETLFGSYSIHIYSERENKTSSILSPRITVNIIDQHFNQSSAVLQSMDIEKLTFSW